MAAGREENICKLLDSYWYKHQILKSNQSDSDIRKQEASAWNQTSWPTTQKDEIIALPIMDCRNDVELKGLLRFWAHSVASTIV